MSPCPFMWFMWSLGVKLRSLCLRERHTFFFFFFSNWAIAVTLTRPLFTVWMQTYHDQTSYPGISAFLNRRLGLLFCGCTMSAQAQVLGVWCTGDGLWEVIESKVCNFTNGFFSFYKNFFCVMWESLSATIYVHHIHAVPTEATRRCWIS